MPDDTAILTPEQVGELLAEPFDPQEVKWKPQSAKGDRALALAYIDARLIADRLDQIVGVAGWEDSYDSLPDGSVVCRLRVKLGEAWVTKMDVGSPSEQPDSHDRVKAAFSDALKRAAVKFGIGRYLYRLPQQWAAYDGQKKRFSEVPRLPQWAMPRQRGAVPQQPQQPPAQQAEDFFARLQQFDAKLVAAGLIEPGMFLEVIAAWGKRAGLPADANRWPDAARQDAMAEASRFQAERRAAKGSPPAKVPVAVGGGTDTHPHRTPPAGGPRGRPEDMDDYDRLRESLHAVTAETKESYELVEQRLLAGLAAAATKQSGQPVEFTSLADLDAQWLTKARVAVGKRLVEIEQTKLALAGAA